MLAKRKVIFLSSKDRQSGSKGDMRMDLAEVVDETDHAVPMHVRSPHHTQRVECALTQLYVPFRGTSDGRVPRFPNCEDEDGQPPIVHVLKFHTDAPHENNCVGGCTTTVAQIPFMRNFEESKDPDVFFSAFVYEENHTEANGRFALTHGLRALKHARFWITDEQDRLLCPAAEVYFGLAIEIYTWDPVITLSGLLDRVTRRTDQHAHIARLQLLQGDEGVRKQLGTYHRSPPPKKKTKRDNGIQRDLPQVQQDAG